MCLKQYHRKYRKSNYLYIIIFSGVVSNTICLYFTSSRIFFVNLAIILCGVSLTLINILKSIFNLQWKDLLQSTVSWLLGLKPWGSKYDVFLKVHMFWEGHKFLWNLHCRFVQGPLITDGRNSCKWTYHCEGLSKSFIMVKTYDQNFWKILSNG